MEVELPFYVAVALAGLAYLVGHGAVHRSPRLQRNFIPEPLVGGLIFALGFLVLRLIGLPVTFPLSGPPLDWLVALLTTNMGLHVTPRLLRTEWQVFWLFLGAAVLLYFVHLLVALPLALFGPALLRTAVLTGPLSLVGLPYNVNPPSQIAPVRALFLPTFANVDELAQGVMMIGVLTGIFLAGMVGRRLCERAGQPPRPSPEKRQSERSLWGLGVAETSLVVLILSLIALSFVVQGWLLERFAWMQAGYLPVIVLSYLSGAAFRLGWETLAPKDKPFPDKPLAILLYGPTMAFVLTYVVMGIPLHHLWQLSWYMVPAALLAVAASAGVAWLAFPVFARFAGDRYYGAVIATALLAVTTAWGPVAMAYLRRFSDEEGPVEPMPVILPLNAFYVIPWMVSLATLAVFAVFG